MNHEIEQQNIYKMKLHEMIELSSDTFVRRVPGGWLYYWWCSRGVCTSFVPLHNEFMEVP